jgi:hypothetical protein
MVRSIATTRGLQGVRLGLPRFLRPIRKGHDPAAESLMIPFAVVIEQVFINRLAKIGFTEKDHPFGHLPFEGTDEPFDMRITVGQQQLLVEREFLA